MELPPNEELVRRYQEGESLMDLALACGTTADRIRAILVAEGVQLRKRGGIKGKKAPRYFRR